MRRAPGMRAQKALPRRPRRQDGTPFWKKEKKLKNTIEGVDFSADLCYNDTVYCNLLLCTKMLPKNGEAQSGEK